MMLGGMLAGHSESGGEIIEKNGKKYKLFYGMSSDTAMKKHAGGVAEYRSEFFFFLELITTRKAHHRLTVSFVCASCLQSIRREDGRSSLQRAGGSHHQRCLRRGPLHLHLCWGGQTEGAEPQDHLHQSHPAAQHGFRQRRLSVAVCSTDCLTPRRCWCIDQSTISHILPFYHSH